MTIRKKIAAAFKRTKEPRMCECAKFRAMVFFEGRALCFVCHETWLTRLELDDLDRRAPDGAPPKMKSMCECGHFEALVVVDGRSFCYNCHDAWLAEHGLGSLPPVAHWSAPRR